jgi:hypothetical protein
MADKVGTQRNRPGEVGHYLADRVTDLQKRFLCRPVNRPIRWGLNAIDLGKWVITLPIELLICKNDFYVDRLTGR